MTKLSWDDLFIQDPAIDFRAILACWPEVRGNVLPIGLSTFGDAFFAKPDDSVWKVDTFSGQVAQVASSQPNFAECMNSLPWQEEHLRSQMVFELVNRGVNRGPLQVFAPVPHPAHAGGIRLERAMALDAIVWHTISSQALGVAQPPTQPKEGKSWWKRW